MRDSICYNKQIEVIYINIQCLKDFPDIKKCTVIYLLHVDMSDNAHHCTYTQALAIWFLYLWSRSSFHEKGRLHLLKAHTLLVFFPYKIDEGLLWICNQHIFCVLFKHTQNKITTKLMSRVASNTLIWYLPVCIHTTWPSK